MKTVVIVGTGGDTLSAIDLLNPAELKLIGIADPREEAWNVFDENGEIRDDFTELPIAPVEMTVALEPDLMLIASVNPVFCDNMRYILIKNGFNNDIIFLRDYMETISVGGAVLRRLLRRIKELDIPGAVAELGCFRGDTSWQINALMPGRKLYLFDTFTGFDSRDIAKEEELGCSRAKVGNFGTATAQRVLERLPYAEQAVLKEGWFPETAADAEKETFCFALLDACLYQPTLSGLEFFFPRMSQGGMILVRRTGDTDFGGVRAALNEFESKYGAFLMIPLGDWSGSVILVHP